MRLRALFRCSAHLASIPLRIVSRRHPSIRTESFLFDPLAPDFRSSCVGTATMVPAAVHHCSGRNCARRSPQSGAQDVASICSRASRCSVVGHGQPFVCSEALRAGRRLPPVRITCPGRFSCSASDGLRQCCRDVAWRRRDLDVVSGSVYSSSPRRRGPSDFRSGISPLRNLSAASSFNAQALGPRLRGDDRFDFSERVPCHCG